VACDQRGHPVEDQVQAERPFLFRRGLVVEDAGRHHRRQ
jgi:hypothetical protein